jgi:4-hydroxyphenylpyruvate dioxygenase
MQKNALTNYEIDHIEIYTPMAKSLAYWHAQALGFQVTAMASQELQLSGFSSYVCTSGQATLVLTAAFPSRHAVAHPEINQFIEQHYCGIKRISLRVDSVKQAFENSIEAGAFPVAYPQQLADQHGFIDLASIKLFDDREIQFINRKQYSGVFKPGYTKTITRTNGAAPLFSAFDHIAAEVRINETAWWSDYVSRALGISTVQTIAPGTENKTGMVLRVNQSPDANLTLVMAEPETYLQHSKVQKNIENFGPGIHHLAFITNDLVTSAATLSERGVEFVRFPDSYYELLSQNAEFSNIDIGQLKRNGIIIDKEGETYLLQKFLQPVSDRPFFFYEIVQRVNGYRGFALKNINVLKKAEEIEIMKA